ncbi:MAG: hypothetical protein MUC77_16535 [Chromatiaceae bacterium]|jgi:hypothetical protein|nr:hypothetical protein [Chromatiaceae bacterium]
MPRDLQKKTRFPRGGRTKVPKDVREKLNKAVETVAKEGRRTVLREDCKKFISAIEAAVSRYVSFSLREHGRWPRGPYGTIPPPNARDNKPWPTKKDYTTPLTKIANELDAIFSQLDLLPIDCIDKLEHGSSIFLLQHGICDEYPKVEVISERALGGSGRVVFPHGPERYRFLMRLEALRYGIERAKESIEYHFSQAASDQRCSDEIEEFDLDLSEAGEVEVRTPVTKPKDDDTPRLIYSVAYAYVTHLGNRPTTRGDDAETPFQKVLRELFDWLSSTYEVRRLGKDRLKQLAQDAVRQLRVAD